MTLDIMLLEERIVLDGAAVDTVAEQIIETQETNEIPDQAEYIHAGAQDANPVEASVSQTETETQGAPRLEVVVIDSAVEDKQAILNSVSDDMTVIVLESGQGLSRVSDLLADMTDIDALHIVSHGESNQITLGGEVIASGNLGDHANELISWQDAFSADADILLYGCNVADSSEADEFLGRIAALTGADVSASDDPTGAENLGGDWELEVKSGSVETDEIVVADYDGTLDTPAMSGTDTTLTAFKGQATAVDPGLTINGSGNITNATVALNNYKAGDALSFTSMHGIAGNFNTTTGVLTLSGTATAENWQELLRTVVFSTSSNDLATNRAATFTLGNMISMEVNGKTHYYELVTSTATVADALSDAESRNYFGLQGYLATVTSVAENNLLGSMFEGMAWIAATDDPNQGVGASEGNFYWFSGPEKGEQFWSGGAPSLGGVSFGGMYANWVGDEPNHMGPENHTVFVCADPGFTRGWYDVPGSQSKQYIVEYGGMPGEQELNLSHSRTIDVITNTAPSTGTNTGLTVQEDASSTTITASMLATTDTEHGASEVTYTITDAPDKGTLKLNGADIGQNSTFTQADIVNNRLSFTPTANAEGSDSFAFTVADSLGASSGPTTFNLTITPDNDAVTTTTPGNLNQTHGYNEGDASVALDDIEVADPDTGEQITATLTLADTSTGALTANDGASYTAGTGVWTITGTVAEVNTALANVAFNPVADNDSDTTISINITDGESAALTGTINLNVTISNDAPTATNTTQTKTYNEGDTSVALDDIEVADPDTDEQITATLTLADTSTGALTANDGASYTAGTGVWTITGTVAEVNAALAAVSFTPATDNDTNTTISVNIKDGLEDGATAKTGTITLNVTGSNDAPTVTNTTQTKTYNEGDTSVALDDIEVADPDTGEQITATLTLADTSTGALTANDGASYTAGTGVWTITGTVAEVNAALANVAFNPVADNDSDTTISINITDGESAAKTGTITLNVTSSNDAPTATNTTQTKTYNEGDASVALDNIEVADPDTGEQITATLTLADTSTGSLTATSGNGENYTAETGVWTITGTVAEVNAALAAVSFTPATDNDTNTTISVNIKDGLEDGATPKTGTITLNVTGSNDAPTATNTTQTKTYNEGDTSVALDDIEVADLDTDEQITATLTLADTSTGALTANDGATYTAGTGVWTITGTVAEVNAALAAVSFTPVSTNKSDTTIEINIADGGENGVAAKTGTIILDCIPAPTPTNPDNSATNTSGNETNPPITDQGKAEQQIKPDSPSGENGPTGANPPESEFNTNTGEFASAAGEFDGPGEAYVDLAQVLNALGDGGDLIDPYSGPVSTDTDLSHVVRALQVAPSTMGGGFGGQADPLSVNTGLGTATAEASSSAENAAPRTGGTGFEQEGQTPGLTGQQNIQADIQSMSVAVEGLRFNSQQADFSVTSLEKAVNQLSELAQTGQVNEPEAMNEISDMADELTEICEKCARKGEDVSELLAKLNNVRQAMTN
ncbi:DUF4347 domain-containing protein [Maridesulfovibrio sp.]|uniref:DUF4347 domain-containing protein n=1 Tax=Maridesulfovibrio sp. TaxID=2795000 RepID=UPI0029CA0956|nr:DUF4347 domain-containing protein [Maridesulfovibrio sp.]